MILLSTKRYCLLRKRRLPDERRPSTRTTALRSQNQALLLVTVTKQIHFASGHNQGTIGAGEVRKVLLHAYISLEGLDKIGTKQKKVA